MIYKLSVPAVAEDVAEFRVLDWHGEVSQAFAPGDLIVELETHKAIVEVRAGQGGIFRKIMVPAASWCRIGSPLGLFSDDLSEPLPEPQFASDLLVEFEIT
jgi:pyruvate/2-oxoglutarate dehydrogenase complex dihydrolipoamide acyltransferase (E2) component